MIHRSLFSFALMILSSLIIHSQTYSPEELRVIFEKTDSLLIVYETNSAMNEAKGSEVSLIMMQQLRSLFDAGALVQDNLQPPVNENGQFTSLVGTEKKPATRYYDELMVNYPGGLSFRIVYSNVAYNKIQSGEIRVVMQREISGDIQGSYRLAAKDTVELKLGILNAGTAVRIKEINVLGSAVDCPTCIIVEQGDKDGDGLKDDFEISINTDPAKPDTDADGLKDGEELTYKTDPLKGDSEGDGLNDGSEIKAKTNPLDSDSDNDGLTDGVEVSENTNPLKEDSDADDLKDNDERTRGTNASKADTDGDGMTDGYEVKNGTNPLIPDTPVIDPLLAYPALSIHTGFGLGTFKHPQLVNSDLNTNVYTDTDTDLMPSEIVGYTGGPPQLSFSGALEFEMLFGKESKNSRFGISAGILFSQAASEITLDRFMVQYGSKDIRDTTYIRIVRAENILEKIKSTNLAIPFKARFSYQFSETLRLNLGLGPLLLLNNKVISTGSTLADYEAIYQYNEATKKFEFDPTQAVDSWDWLLTEENYSNDTDAQAAFDEHYAAGYDVGLNVFREAENTYNFNENALGTIFDVSLGIKTGNSSDLNLGLQWTSFTLKKTRLDYVMVDRVDDPYVSMLDPLQEVKNSAFEFHVGFRIFMGGKK